jgi:hypothetical protein
MELTEEEEEIINKHREEKAYADFEAEKAKIIKRAKIRKQWEKDNPEGDRIQWEKYIDENPI